jgi:hypothetical protein
MLANTLNKLYCSMKSFPAELKQQELPEAKLSQLITDVLTIIERLKTKRQTTNIIFFHANLLLLRSLTPLKQEEHSNCSRAQLKYYLLSALLISSKFLEEDSPFSADCLAKLFKYDLARISKIEKKLLFDVLQFKITFAMTEFDSFGTI